MRGGLVYRAALEEAEEVLVLDDGMLLPGLHHRLAARPVVEALLEQVHMGDETRVVAAVEVDVVEGEVRVVVAVEVAGGDRLGHRRVEFAHAGEVGGAERGADVPERGGFEGADDLVEVADVVERQRVEAEPAAGQDRDETLRLEVEERFAQRRAADAQTGGEFVQVEECAGLEAAPGHFVAQEVVDLFPEGTGLQGSGSWPGFSGRAGSPMGGHLRHQISNISEPGVIGVRPGSDPTDARRSRAMLRAKECS